MKEVIILKNYEVKDPKDLMEKEIDYKKTIANKDVPSALKEVFLKSAFGKELSEKSQSDDSILVFNDSFENSLLNIYQNAVMEVKEVIKILLKNSGKDSLEDYGNEDLTSLLKMTFSSLEFYKDLVFGENLENALSNQKLNDEKSTGLFVPGKFTDKKTIYSQLLEQVPVLDSAIRENKNVYPTNDVGAETIIIHDSKSFTPRVFMNYNDTFLMTISASFNGINLYFYNEELDQWFAFYVNSMPIRKEDETVKTLFIFLDKKELVDFQLTHTLAGVNESDVYQNDQGQDLGKETVVPQVMGNINKKSFEINFKNFF